MQRLRGSDAFAIYSESPTSPFVTLKVAIYRPTHSDDIPTAADIRQFIRQSVDRYGARARLRILRVPLDLHHPVWVADPDFDPDDHIHEAELPSPGTRSQLCDFISELMSQPLAPDRPLWETWIVSGLENERVALVSKLHHALADGNHIVEMIASNHDSAPVADDPAAGQQDAIPTRTRLVADALLDLFKSYTLDLPEYARYLKQARARGKVLRNAEGDESGGAGFAPMTILNSEGGGERLYRYELASLPAIKQLARDFGCTVNAMVLGICSEGMKRYLQDVDELPATPLRTAMPIGSLGEEDFRTHLNATIHNNNVTVAFVPLDLHISDLRERVQQIKQDAAAAIQHARASSGKRIDNYLDYLPGTAIRLLNAALKRQITRFHKPFANLIISNVKGPGETLYAVDGRLEMEQLLSTGNLQDGGSLNITIWSYTDKLCISCYSRKGALPEPDKINRYIREVIEELGLGYPATW